MELGGHAAFMSLLTAIKHCVKKEEESCYPLVMPEAQKTKGSGDTAPRSLASLMQLAVRVKIGSSIEGIY